MKNHENSNVIFLVLVSLIFSVSCGKFSGTEFKGRSTENRKVNEDQATATQKIDESIKNDVEEDTKVDISNIVAQNEVAQIPPEINAADKINLKIEKISYSGTGCEKGTVTGDISEDGQAFTVLFNKFTAEAGPELERTARQKWCRLQFTLAMEKGWQFSIVSFDYRGYANLEDASTKGYQRTYYYFPRTHGPVKKLLLTKKFKGPLNDDFSTTHKIGLSKNIWSPCHSLPSKQKMRIDTIFGVMAPDDKQAMLTLDSLDGEIKEQTFGLAWRRCHSSH